MASQTSITVRATHVTLGYSTWRVAISGPARAGQRAFWQENPGPSSPGPVMSGSVAPLAVG
jgi:hypothetical protein